jgi:ABC-2 type transport system ATP-binding protein
MDAIRVDGLRREFGETVAVDDISLSVPEGELFGLLGPNGAGKSTLINMCCTLLRPTAGDATINGHDIRTEMGAVRDSIGVVFQETALDDDLTGEENLVFHARLYGLPADERRERIDEVLELVDLGDERDRRVDGYSGGMKRRLEIARGLLHEPAVLFLDEPTLGLDAGTRRDTWEYIRAMNETGVTVVLTTHYMEEADALCDRVAIVDDGTIVARDTPANLKARLGGEIISVETTDDPTPLVDALGDSDWVESIERTTAGLTVTPVEGASRLPDIVRAADRVGVTITTIDRQTPTLETVFLSLTGREIAAGGEPAGGSPQAVSADGGHE